MDFAFTYRLNIAHKSLRKCYEWLNSVTQLYVTHVIQKTAELKFNSFSQLDVHQALLSRSRNKIDVETSRIDQHQQLSDVIIGQQADNQQSINDF